jgi:hypothetical protein
MGIQERASPEWGHPGGPKYGIGRIRPSPERREGDQRQGSPAY